MRYNYKMSKLLEQAIAEARKLPPDEQDAVGAIILAEIADEGTSARHGLSATRNSPTQALSSSKFFIRSLGRQQRWT